MQSMLFKALEKYNQNTDANNELSQNIEDVYFKEYYENLHNESLYKKKLTDIIFNLRDPKNDILREKLLHGLISCSVLIKMTNEELANPELQVQRKENEHEMTKEMMENCLTGSKGSTAFKCGKCKKSNTKHYQMQTRSADEPMTIFITCIECGNRWRC
eukprot:GAHX01001448.1.p1 GENE.GAHX01001448.1~~GAHX01001448.1.p1  ORF type:complete len:170 (+),score=28.98 GAHX01001448.1:35-511(+)